MEAIFPTTSMFPTNSHSTSSSSSSTSAILEGNYLDRKVGDVMLDPSAQKLLILDHFEDKNAALSVTDFGKLMSSKRNAHAAHACGDNDIIKFCSCSGMRDMADKESCIMLWDMLVPLLRSKGQVEGSELAELLLKDTRDTTGHIEVASNNRSRASCHREM